MTEDNPDQTQPPAESIVAISARTTLPIDSQVPHARLYGLQLYASIPPGGGSAETEMHAVEESDQ